MNSRTPSVLVLLFRSFSFSVSFFLSLFKERSRRRNREGVVKGMGRAKVNFSLKLGILLLLKSRSHTEIVQRTFGFPSS